MIAGYQKENKKGNSPERTLACQSFQAEPCSGKKFPDGEWYAREMATCITII